MKTSMLAGLLVLILAAPVLAQDSLNGALPLMPKDLRLAGSLYDVDRLVKSQVWKAGELRPELRAHGLQLDAGNRVHVRIVGQEGGPGIEPAVVKAFGGQDDGGWRHCRDAWVPADQLIALARALPAGYRLEAAVPPIPCATVSEGPEVTNSDSYRDGGADGRGLLIGVMDGGFLGLTASRASGDAPAASMTTTVNFSTNPIESVTDHGTACLETIFDHCPGARYRLYMTDTDTDWGLVAEDAVNAGVDVFTASINAIGAGWHDNTGVAAAAANLAASNGILFFVSAGNWSQQHWEGVFSPHMALPAWHNFGGGDRFLDIVVESGDEMRAFLQWNNDSQPTDYDLYLLDSEMNILRHADSGGTQPENLAWTNETGSAQTCYITIVKASGGDVPCELFAIGCTWQEHIVPSGSTVSPGNATAPLVFAVGAVRWSRFTSPNGVTWILMGDSSRGPSNDGMILPDLVGPTETSVGLWEPGMGFGGTSCATPNAAGTAGAFWSADKLLDPHAIRHLLNQQAGAWRDWGDAGQDNLFGYGGVGLYDYAPNTLWVERAYGNLSNDRAYPLYHVSVAQSLATPGGRLLFFLDGNYPEPCTLNKPMRIVSGFGTSRVGQ